MGPSEVDLLGIRAGAGAGTPGAGEGPRALRERGLVATLVAAGHDVRDLGDIPGVYETRFATGPHGTLHDLARVLQVNRHTHACVLGARRRNPASFLLIVGGDHSLAIGTLAGLSDSCGRLGLLWLDAHADFNTPASSPSGNIHGMSLAVACGRGNRDLRSIGACDPMVLEQDVRLYGVRDLDAGERRALEASDIRVLSKTELLAQGGAAAIVSAAEELARNCDHVHLSFDIDVVDPPHVRGTGTPVADGLAPELCRAALAGLGRAGVLRSAEIVEYNPTLDADGATGALVLDLVLALMSRPGDEPQSEPRQSEP